MDIQMMFIEELVKKEIVQFLSRYEDVKDVPFFEIYKELYKKYYDETMERIFCIYPKFKRHDLRHFGEQVFNIEVESKDIDNYYKIQFNGMLYVIEKYNDLLLSFENDFLSCDRQVFNGIVEYLKNNIICSFVVLQQIELIKKIKPIREVGFQNRIDSNDCYRSSVNLKHNLNAYSSLSSQNASVFLIRQSIELKIKNCLGIDVILDSHGYMKKMTADKLIDFVYKNEHIKIPEIGKSIIKKIHSWTQFFIHGGFILNVWQIDIAQEIIRPLFMHGKTQKTISIYGSIVIDKVYYETEFRNELKRFLIESCSMEPDIQIIQKNPEAIIE